MAVKIAIYNTKGGVGKTTSAKAIAGELAKNHGKKVLIIDCAANGYISAGLKHEGEPTMDYAKMIIENCADGSKSNPHACICNTSFTNLDIMYSTRSEMMAAEEALMNTDFNANIVFMNLFSSLDSDYDFIFLDCGSGEGSAITTNALVFADYALIPFTPDVDAVNGYKATLERIKETRHDKAKFSVLGSFITRYNRITILSQIAYQSSIESIYGFIPITIRQTSEVDDARLSQAPPCYYDPEGKLAEDYAKLTSKILERLKQSM